MSTTTPVPIAREHASRVTNRDTEARTPDGDTIPIPAGTHVTATEATPDWVVVLHADHPDLLAVRAEHLSPGRDLAADADRVLEAVTAEQERRGGGWVHADWALRPLELDAVWQWEVIEHLIEEGRLVAQVGTSRVRLAGAPPASPAE